MSSNTNNSRVTEIPGDLFDAPDGSALIHACNVQGAWGAGIAEAFKQKYPAAYRYYDAHCQTYRYDDTTHLITNLQADDESTIPVRLPLGTALIIPPRTSDYSAGQKRHWIICLFTSRSFGRRVDPPDLVLNSTFAALKDLKAQLDGLRERNESVPNGLYSCRFNSGLFAVPWERTKGLVERVGLDLTVVNPESKGGQEES